MPRPQRCRTICCEPEYDAFYPAGIACGEAVTLTVDEYEIIRLVDLCDLTHDMAAKRMDISRTTATEIYNSARKKLAQAIVGGRRLVVSGGNYRLCDGSKCAACRIFGDGGEKFISRKGNGIMRIAVAYENGEIFQHFGHTEQFKLYDAADGRVISSEVVSTQGSGHGALAGFLKGCGVDTLICGGIGGGAQTALAKEGIALFGGVSGAADAAVEALLEGKLTFDPNIRCSHHSHGHGDCTTGCK